jgi:HK97 gp10 family phage protein
MDVKVKLQGFEDLAAKLRALAPAMRKRVLRNALAAGARLVRDDAKRRAPVLKAGSKAPYRKAGTVRDAIKVRTSKRDRKDGDVGVFVNVKPLKKEQIRSFKASGGGSGFKNPNDPYYWQWLEFGRSQRSSSSARDRVARVKRKGKVLVKGVRFRRALRAVGAIKPIGFLRYGANKLPEALRIFEKTLGSWIDKVNRTGKVEP